jgi:hypothetical protein
MGVGGEPVYSITRESLITTQSLPHVSDWLRTFRRVTPPTPYGGDRDRIHHTLAQHHEQAVHMKAWRGSVATTPEPGLFVGGR